MRRITGYATRFDIRSRDLGGFVEVVRPGAFEAILERRLDVVALIDHDPDQLLGRTSSGTLRLWCDGHGLRYEIDLPQSRAAEIVSRIQSKDLPGSSFGFGLAGVTDRWHVEGDTIIRTISKFGQLLDVSVCSRPAYPTTVCWEVP